MAGAQAFLMGLVALLPEKFGMKDLNGFEGYVHLWAIIGRGGRVQLQYKKTKSLDAERELYERYVIQILEALGHQRCCFPHFWSTSFTAYKCSGVVVKL